MAKTELVWRIAVYSNEVTEAEWQIIKRFLKRYIIKYHETRVMRV